MTIFLIWVRESDGLLWLVEAWDDDSTAGNPDGWQAAKDKAYKEFGAENVLIVQTVIDFDKVQELFSAPPTISNNGIRGEDS